MNNKLAKLGMRLCEYAKSIGCRVDWKHAYPHLLYLAVIAPCSIYSAWESVSYKGGERSKWKAYHEFASFVINAEPTGPRFSLNDLEFSPICDVLAYAMAASSAEELDLRLSVLGF